MKNNKLSDENIKILENLKTKFTNKFNEYVQKNVDKLDVIELFPLDSIVFEKSLNAIILDANKVEKNHTYLFNWRPDLDPYFKLLENQFMEIIDRKNFVRFGTIDTDA